MRTHRPSEKVVEKGTMNRQSLEGGWRRKLIMSGLLGKNMLIAHIKRETAIQLITLLFRAITE